MKLCKPCGGKGWTVKPVGDGWYTHENCKACNSTGRVEIPIVLYQIVESDPYERNTP